MTPRSIAPDADDSRAPAHRSAIRPHVVRRAGAALLVVAAATVFAPVGANAAGSPAGTRMAELRGAHLSPDTAGVDVYLTSFSGHRSTLWLSSVGYGDVSPYRTMRPGVYAVSMRPHGAPASSPAALRWTVHLRPGRAYTAAAVGMNKHLRGIVLDDELHAPPAGHGLIRVIQAASRAHRATVYSVGGPVVARRARFATTTHYATVPAGRWKLRAVSATGSPKYRTTSTVRVHSGTVESVVVLDAKHRGITLRTLVDAAGARQAPTGAVPAGGGGTARTVVDGGSGTSSALWATLCGVAALALAATMLTVARRRRPVRR